MIDRIGRYRIVKALGEGGMGRVLLAEVAGAGGFQRSVVLKVVRDELDPGLKSALLDEARLTATLIHRNLVPVLDLDEVQGQQLVVLEYVDGLDLRHLLVRKDRLPWPLVTFVGMEVAAGLDYAHRKTDGAGRPLGIVHRDVSPANILLSWEGEVKLTDFGVAKVRRPDESLGGLKGNLGYMAPEQARGEAIDPRADLYALGVALYEALTGKNPFHGRNDLARLARVREGRVPPLPSSVAPPALRAAIARATAADPAARFADAASFREALVHVPEQPADPARQLRSFLEPLRLHGDVARDALYEAVLGGGRPITHVAHRTAAPEETTAPRVGPPRWLVVAASLLLIASVGLAFYKVLGSTTGLRWPFARLGGGLDPTLDPALPPTRPGWASRPVSQPESPLGHRPDPQDQDDLSGPPQPGPPTEADPIVAPTAADPPVATAADPIAPTARARPVRRPPRRGSLSVNAIPWAKLTIDGRAQGHTPRLRIPLPPGRHRLRLVTKSGEVRNRVVEVQPGREARVTVLFAEP